MPVCLVRVGDTDVLVCSQGTQILFEESWTATQTRPRSFPGLSLDTNEQALHCDAEHTDLHKDAAHDASSVDQAALHFNFPAEFCSWDLQVGI